MILCLESSPLRLRHRKIERGACCRRYLYMLSCSDGYDSVVFINIPRHNYFCLHVFIFYLAHQTVTLSLIRHALPTSFLFLILPAIVSSSYFHGLLPPMSSQFYYNSLTYQRMNLFIKVRLSALHHPHLHVNGVIASPSFVLGCRRLHAEICDASRDRDAR